MTLKYGLGIVQGHEKWYRTIRKLEYGFLLAFYSNDGSSCVVSEIQARCWSKIAIDHTL